MAEHYNPKSKNPILMQKLLLLLLLPAVCFGQGDQTIISVPLDSYGNSEKAILHLPDDYSKTTTKYPILVFLHGIGEGGTNPGSIYNSSTAGGPAYFIAQGTFPSSFTNPKDGKSYKYIVVSPQNATGWSTMAFQLDYILTYLLKQYRVDPARVYLTGLSAGGEGVTEYVGKISTGNVAVATTHKIAAFMPMSAAIDGTLDPLYATQIVTDNVGVWGFGSPSDIFGIYTLNLVTDVQAKKAGLAISTSYSGGHCCWNNFYNPTYKLNGMSIYEWALQYTQGTPSDPSDPSSIPSSPSGPTTPVTVTIPAKVEAEAYTAMSGISTETTTDTGGGKDVGWIDANDYMDYSISVPADGQYTVSFRVASASGGTFQAMLASGTVLSSVTVPNTGDWQAWQTVKANVTLSKGTQTFRIKCISGNYNINWLQFDTAVVTSPTDPSTGGTPVKIEAEAWSAMSGVSTETTTDAGGGLDVGWIDQNDWMDYSVNVPADGQYTVSFRVSSGSGGTFQAMLPSGSVLATVTVPNTGGWQAWQTVTAKVALSKGAQTFRIKCTSGNYNINWLSFDFGSTTSTPPATTPTQIEAEAWSGMSGVSTETTTDAGGGLDVGWIDQNDWMDYSINVPADGQYTVSFRVASATGGSFQAMLPSGAVLATIVVPNYGGWQDWHTMTANVTLSKGAQTFRIKCTAGNFNINWLSFDFGNTAAPPTSIQIEAENYAAMSGVSTETTTDDGGGLNVGWIDQNDWMDYSVNVPAAGQYKIGFRVASATGGTFQVLSPSGSVLSTIVVPNYGGWQDWHTMTIDATLAKGLQTFRVKCTAGNFNINWLLFTSSGTTAAATERNASSAVAAMMAGDSASIFGDKELVLWPNPVHDLVNVRVVNGQTGSLLVQVTDALGGVKAVYNYSKTSDVWQTSLDLGRLTDGVYFIRIISGNKTEVRKIVKM